MMSSDTEDKLLAQSLISAAARHDVIAVKNLLRNVSANVQDGETGYTPLHATVAGCAPPEDEPESADADAGAGAAGPEKVKPVGKVSLVSVSAEKEEQASEVVQLLFENGAIWNDIDAQDETAACIAWRLGMKKVYQSIVDAGVRAEVLLSRLAELEGSEGDEEGESEADDEEEDAHTDDDAGAETAKASDSETQEKAESNGAEPHAGQSKEASNAGAEVDPNYIDHWDSNNAFLRSSLRFTPTQLLDSSGNAVMMDWETQLMGRHAAALLPRPGLRAMNIGHGMGIVDAAIQTHQPKEHHIVEAHPAVLARLKENGWLDKPGVRVHEGRWQDVLPQLVNEGVEVDAIYYDTFAEGYKDFKDLFSEHVIGLMDQEGRFGFYHGLGADRRVCYDVYTAVAEMDLQEAGFKTEWEELPVPEIEWKGVRRPYWNVDVYRLPTCTYL